MTTSIRSMSVVLMCTATCLAEPPRVGMVQAWMTREWEQSKSFPTTRAFSLSYKIEHRETPPAQEVARIRSAVTGHPDHPDRHRVQVWEARLAGNFDWTEVAYWSDPSGGVSRHNRTDSMGIKGDGSLGQTLFDTVVDRKIAWGLSDTQLTIEDVRQPDPSYNFQRFRGSQNNEIFWVFSAGVSSGFACGLPVPTVEVHGSRWIAVSEAAFEEPHRRFRFEASGTWDSGNSVGIIERVDVSCEVKPSDRYKPFSLRYISSGHQYLPGLDRWVPERVEHWKGDPAPLRLYAKYDNFRATEVTQAEVRTLAVLPKMGESDPIRGALAFSSVLDVRPDVQAYRNKTDTGEIEVIPLSQTTEFKNRSRLSQYGKLAVTLIVVALVSIRVRSWLQSKTSQ